MNNQNFNHEQETEQWENPFAKEIEKIAEKQKANDDVIGKGEKNFVPKADDYQKDGIWHCGICNEPMQANASIVGLIHRPCRCERAKKDAEARKEKKQKADDRRKDAFGSYRNRRFLFTFENDDGQSPIVSKQMKTYCEKFDEYRKSGTGLLLHSEHNGGGKTFFSCAIANELIDRGYRVKVTDFKTLRDELFSVSNKMDYIMKLRSHDVVVIDDLGAENNTEHMMEVEYRIIDDLTENYTPLILTTNYTLREMNETTDRDKKRIFDRVFGSCIPVNIEPPEGKSRRLKNCKQITTDFRNLAAADHT